MLPVFLKTKVRDCSADITALCSFVNMVTSHHCCPGSDVPWGMKPQIKVFLQILVLCQTGPFTSLAPLKWSLQIQQQHQHELTLRHFKWPGWAVTSGAVWVSQHSHQSLMKMGIPTDLLRLGINTDCAATVVLNNLTKMTMCSFMVRSGTEAAVM